MNLRLPFLALLATAACASATRSGESTTYDVVISGGRIVDGTGNPWTYGALIYPPGAYATTDELVAMAEAMAPYHGVYISHIRSEDDQLLEALDEALAIGKRGGVSLGQCERQPAAQPS